MTIQPNQVDPRVAMGLPAVFLDRPHGDLYERNRDLFRLDPAKLVLIAEDPTVEFERRFAAGHVLALVGDPRIEPFAPRMLDVPGGRVRIGLPEHEVARVVRDWRQVGVLPEWIEKEVPEHTVELAPYRIARFPVTNAEFRLFLLDTGSLSLPSSWNFGRYPHPRANHPVWTVRPEDADKYATWLAARTGRQFRLPTESEWEFAASGGDGREYPWGDQFYVNAANTVEGGPLMTTPVGLFPAGRSPFGLDDMGGNVEEYVADEYRPYPGGRAVADDLAGSWLAYRVARGGSFARYGDLARCRRRHGWYDGPIYAMGFRLAETVNRTGDHG
ncbi:SUMF1/EgtB/PvdO family nonheme iron enzyme [Longispora sp. K20-0274]|uniref:formylglycine-generating enzyme family protein n=1 Tax=Longispora sp. K20-0274 TaxID=3088255 RepID=UPI00399ACFD6